MIKAFGILFILTGIFAIAGGFYTWGDGIIFDKSELVKVLIPWADIILTGPLSLLCGYALLEKYFWGQILGLCTSGIYIFGSLLVFINIFWNDNYSIYLLIPAISGFFIGLGFIVFEIKRKLS